MIGWLFRALHSAFGDGQLHSSERPCPTLVRGIRLADVKRRVFRKRVGEQLPIMGADAEEEIIMRSRTLARGPAAALTRLLP